MNKLNEIKVMFLGDGGAGKTALTRVLYNELLNLEETQTYEWRGWTYINRCKHQDITLHFWDFSGEAIFYATYQFFLSKRSLYILVLDLRSERAEENAEYWLKQVHLFGDDSPVLIVLNKSDISNLDINRRYLMEKYPNIQGFYKLSCANGQGLKEFQFGLQQALEKSEMVQALWQDSWFSVKTELENLNKGRITCDEYYQICNKYNVTNSESQRILAEYLHDLGIIIYFSDFILNSNWVVQFLPPEIIKQGNTAIKAYFDSLEQKRPLNELKVLFVGDGGAGKTSLSKLLRDQTFDPHENQTHGINIDDWKVGDITAHLWDFGGQEIMRATHKFFLSKRSLYVLVLDNREERDEERWLKRIESFGGNSPILIVLNKCEQNASYDVDRRDLVRRYSGLQTQDFYFVSCANGQGIAAFKQGLIAAFNRVELINSVLPESWFQVKTALEQQQRQQHYISYDRYIEICQQQQIADTQTQDILARLLHDLGVSVHFEDLALLDTHVLEPKWITEGVYKIITSPQLTERQGVLYEADLPEILKKQAEDDYFYPPTKYAYLLELMKKFELSYRLNDKAVLIPQLLKPEEPEFAFDDSGQVLRFQILYDYLDDSIMPRFIVALHQDIDNRIQWRKGVLLKNPSFNSQAVVRVNYQDRLLTIVVKGEQKRDYFAVIRKALQDIHASFEWKKPPVELVPLPDNPEFTVKYTNLIGYEKAGEEKYFDGELGKYYSVSELLNGLEKPETRQKSADSHQHTHHHYGDYIEEKIMTDKSISIGSNVQVGNGSFVTGKIENSFNNLQESKASDEVKALLQQLLTQIEDLNSKVPEQVIQTITEETETLIAESNRETPRKHWYEASLKGILEATKSVVEAAPIFEIATKLSPLLLGI